MSLTGEVPQATEELTTANMGDVLLFAYAGYLRENQADRSMAGHLRTAADHLERQALDQLETLPLEGLDYDEVTTELMNQEQVTNSATRAMALRGLADRVSRMHDMPGADLNTNAFYGRSVTVTKLEGRPVEMYRGQHGKEAVQVAGHISSIHLYTHNSSLWFMSRWPRKPWVVNSLVDPGDLQANVTIQFNE